jgi:hypothetical protein
MEDKQTKTKIKRSCSLHDLKEISKLVKSSSLENFKTEEMETKPINNKKHLWNDKEEELLISVNSKTFQDVDIHKINKIMCDLEKCKLMQKALDLGLSIKNIVECLIECDYLDEEKFFEKLIESVVKSTDGQKGNNKDESYDLIDTFAQEGNPTENKEYRTNKSQLGVQKQKNANKLNSNLRPIIVDGIDVATR